MTRINNRGKVKENIGYEKRVFIHPKGVYYHFKKDCSMLVPNDIEFIGYKEVPISHVGEKYIACPLCKNLGKEI
jgi:hypothetical protein